MTEEIIKECKNCDALGIDSEIGVYYCCLSHRQDDLPKEFTCNDFTPNKQLKRLEQERDELKKTVENQKLEYEELQCDLSEVENACGCYQSENAELKQENKDLKDNNNHLQAIIDDGRAENKRFREENKELKSETLQWKQIKDMANNNKYRSALEEIREWLIKWRYDANILKHTNEPLDKINEVLK